MARTLSQPNFDETPEQALRRRVRRFRRRGENRRAMLALREAALKNDRDAKVWTLYGAECMRMGRRDAARDALRHAAWLREREREYGKARTTRRLLELLEAA